MSKLPWPQFRTQLFDKMEERRSKTSIFRFEQIYRFIECCSQLWADDETAEGQNVVLAIAHEGTFLMVADSLQEFYDLFLPVPGEQDPKMQSNQPSSQPPQPTRDARQRSGSPFRQE